ncbi:MAG: peptidase [Sphingomonas bacterium]|uniref:M16 family metallopeptidase n=1 Tax=Sphingomonas bacterium TaxID=1895847 RepID=UPI00262CE579|nr:pitrilysin family protein [Sphingomonas bacterium]MDB5707699.1 peptidase [Sphingomonas bacterium]
MRLYRAALLLGAALLPLSAQAQKAPTSAAAVKPLDFTERTLANGLRVYAIRDTGTSNVSVQVWYDVGSKDDPAGRSGFAHMFEHLMFKATKNLVSEQMDRLTEDVGGYNNASTNDDYTNYYEVVPANHLQRLLFAEADRMASLVVEPKSFASERDVVKEELRLRTLAQPYGKLFSIYFPEISYTRHPYARPGIGSLENLESATIDDVRAFHATYYRPDNAILVVSGNFDPKQLDAWIDQYFTDIKKPDRPIPRVTVVEPERTKATHVTVYEPNTPLPAVAISYPLPPDNDPDSPALSVLNAVLSQGESSRLYETLVYRDQIAQNAETYLDTKQGPGALGAIAIMAGGKTADEGEKALRREIARLRDAPVTPAELTEAKNEILTGALRGRETAEGKASTLAASVIIDGDPRASDRQLAAIAEVTAADVQRVARKYLRDERSAAIHYLPAESAPAGVKGDTVTVASTVEVAPLVTPPNVVVVTPAADADRIAPPVAGPALAAAIPTPQAFKLANGLSVIVAEKHDLPLLSASLVARGGGASDPDARAGLASLTADLLTKGTTTRSATQIAAEIEALGGSIGSDADWDGSSITVTVKSDQATPALNILADVARHPAFATEELERARAQAIDSVSVTLKNPAQLAGLVAGRAVFGIEPYGHALSGTPASLKAIQPVDVRRAYDGTWLPAQATLILVGDITPAAARVLAEKNFAGWQAPKNPAGPVVTSVLSTPIRPRVIVVDMPGAGQAGVIVARPGIARRDPAFYPASVANTVLGGGFSSRLNQEIRIKRGLAYGAGSSLSARRNPGSISARTQTKNPTAPETVAIMIAEMKRLGAEPVPANELEPRKATLIGDFGRGIETTDGLADVLGDYVVEEVPLGELKAFTASVSAVDPAAVQAAAAKLLDPTQASIIVVGDSKDFIDALRKQYPDLELIPASALNLDTAALK